MPTRDTVSDARSVVPPKIVPPSIESTNVAVIDPRNLLNDSLAEALAGKWKDRQQHGRIVYDLMLRHPAVRAPFEIIMSFIKSAEVSFSPLSTDPSEKEKEMADFLNSQIQRLGNSGEARDGWNKLVDGLIGNGLQFGFGLAEMGIRVENWRGRPMKQLSQIRVLPQASLDDGYVPHEEFGDLGQVDPRYRCFDFVSDGKIERVWQYRDFTYKTTENGVSRPVATSGYERTWDGANLLRILHYAHKGGDNNPFGESILYTAFYPWSDLYLLERQEQNFLDVNSVPYLTATRDSDVESPGFNDEVKEIVLEQDPRFRVLVATNAKFGSVSASNPEYTKHIKQIKDELRNYITQSVLVPQSIYAESSQQDQTVRDVIQMFVKFRLPAILKEIEDFFTWQLGRRLIDANYSNVEVENYPRLHFRVHLDNDVRLVSSVLPQILPYLDANRLGEALEALLPGIRKEYIPKEHDNSVDVLRPKRDTNDQYPLTPDSKTQTPDTTGTRNDGGGGDGSTKNLGKNVGTAV